MKDVVTLHVRAVAKQRQQNNNSTEQNGPHSTRSQTSIEEDTEENSKDREKKYYYIAGCCLRVACKQVALQHESKKKVTLKMMIENQLNLSSMLVWLANFYQDERRFWPYF